MPLLIRGQLLWRSFSLLLLFPFLAVAAAREDGVFARNFVPDLQTKQKQKSDCHSQVYSTRFDGVTWDNTNWRLTTTALDQGHYQSRASIANGYLGISVASVGPFFELDVPVEGDVINGWPLFSRRQSFATISGFYDLQPSTNDSNFPWLNQYGGESVISGVPHWAGLVLDLEDGNYLDAAVKNTTISKFKSTLDMKGGVLTWEYTWTPEGRSDSFDIVYQMFAHKVDVNRAVVHMEVTPSADTHGTVANVFDGFSAVRTDFAGSGEDGQSIYSSVRPTGISNVTAYFYAQMNGSQGLDMGSLHKITDKPYIHTNDSSVAQAADVKFRAGETVTISKFVGGASSDGFSDPQSTARNACTTALNAGYRALLRSHIDEWATIFPEDSVDDFTLPETGWLPIDGHIIEAAITAVANPYYLLQSTVGKNALKAVENAPIDAGSISVGGLVSDSYAGQIFWDADVWMQPGFVAAFPEAGQTFTNYRLAQFGQADANADTAFTSSKNQTSISPGAAIYPWTSGRFGNCTGTGPCFDYQYHLNGDIGLQMINNWVSTGDTPYFKKTLYPVYQSIATLFADVVERNETKWTLTNMTDPVNIIFFLLFFLSYAYFDYVLTYVQDEFADHVDAGGYTMPMIATTLMYANSFRKMFGFEQNQTWNDMAENVLIERDADSGVTLEYTTMNGSTSVKQADIVLNTFPLRYTRNYTPQDSLTDLDYVCRQHPPQPIHTVFANQFRM